MRRSLSVILLCSTILAHGQSRPLHQKPVVKAKDTQHVLTLLLESSDAEIPSSSSCRGFFGQTGEPRIKDLLSMELASFFAGQNRLVGKCESDRSCAIELSHKYGESSSSAKISFKIADGKVQLGTLSCVLTP
jgi:hypothetical protein